MSSAKLAVASSIAAIVLGGCGSGKPAASTRTFSPKSSTRGRIDDPRTNNPNRVECLRDAHLPVQKVGQIELQIGSLPAGPTVVFLPTAGSAQADQIQGKVGGAEVIGSALLYPNQASDSELSKIEKCLTKGVRG